MILCDKTLKEIFGNKYDEEQYQPNGIDLRVKTIEELIPAENIGIIDNVKKLPHTKEITPNEDGIIVLKKNTMYVFDLGKHYIPEHTVGTFEIRSTLMRMGAILSSSLADQGYKGSLRMNYYNPIMDINLKLNERVVQMIIHTAENGSLYNGSYQNDEFYKE